jgi:hypothetical protein
LFALKSVHSCFLLWCLFPNLCRSRERETETESCCAAL